MAAMYFLISEAFPSLFFEKEDTNSLTKKYLPAIPIMEEDGYGKKING